MVFLTKLKPEPMGAHSLSVAYGVNSLVMSGDGAAAYISVKDVPAGTPLSNTDYWQPHTDLTSVRQSAEAAAQKANAARDEMLEIARNLTDAVEKSGNPVQAELVGGLPFDRVATSLEPIQAGSGDPSPTNIRPISGRTGATLTRCGKNMMPTSASDIVTGFGITVKGGQKSGIVLYGTASASGGVKAAGIDALPAGTYTVSTGALGGVNRIEVTVNGVAISQVMEDTPYTLTLAETSSVGLNVIIYNGADCGTESNPTRIDVQLEKGRAVTDYAPYQGNTYAASFGQTVYGGTLDWQTGVLTVDSGIVTLDGNNLKALYMSSGTDYIQVRLGDKLPDARNQAGNGNLICSHLPEQYGLFSDFPYPHLYLDVSGTPFIRAYFSVTLAPTIEDLNAYLAAQYAAGTPVQIVYKLATPTTIQLTPQEIRQLQGANMLYGDGSITIVGRANPAIALDARIAALEAAATAE